MARHLLRIGLWALASLALWKLLDPVWRTVLEGLVGIMVVLMGSEAEVIVGKSNASPVLFLALYLAERPKWRRAAVVIPLGLFACLLLQALAIATLATHPSHRALGDRLLRSLVVGLDKAGPIIIWLLVSRRRWPYVRPGHGDRSN